MKGEEWDEYWKFEVEDFKCPPNMMKTNECDMFYTQYRFDAQDIEVIVN